MCRERERELPDTVAFAIACLSFLLGTATSSRVCRYQVVLFSFYSFSIVFFLKCKPKYTRREQLEKERTTETDSRISRSIAYRIWNESPLASWLTILSSFWGFFFFSFHLLEAKQPTITPLDHLFVYHA